MDKSQLTSILNKLQREKVKKRRIIQEYLMTNIIPDDGQSIIDSYIERNIIRSGDFIMRF